MNKDLIIKYLQLKAEVSAYKNDPDNKEAESIGYALDNAYYTLCEIAGFKESCWTEEVLQQEIVDLEEELKEYKEEEC